MKYQAKDLKDIASVFEKNAENEERWAKGARTVAERRQADVAAKTWRAAADMLNSTELAKG